MCFCIDLLEWILFKVDDIFKVTKEGISLPERAVRLLAAAASLTVLVYGVLKLIGMVLP
jgi:hypothetical protein